VRQYLPLAHQKHHHENWKSRKISRTVLLNILI
jgi:hypothetical protein